MAGTSKASQPVASPPGLRQQYNHDLNVSADFRSGFPQIGECLYDARLYQAFQAYDNEAMSCKRWFERLGLWSLVLGTIPLLMAAARLAIGETRFATVHLIGVEGDFCAAAAVLLVIWMRFKRFRSRWCIAVFCREQLRLWHFRKFLDGELISKCGSQPDEFKDALDKRWKKLEEQFKSAPGMMRQFVSGASEDDESFQVTPYADSSIAAEVFEALGTLRFEHQLGYAGHKVEPDSGEPGMVLMERTTASETVATATFAGAILVTAIAFFLSLTETIPRLGALSVPHGTGRVLAGTSLFLAVLSASSRAYRAGFTLPDEPESYEEYEDRVREIKVAFDNPTTDRDKQHQLRRLERTASAELRRFLRMKMRATFVS